MFPKAPLTNQRNHLQAKLAVWQRPAPFLLRSVGLMEARTTRLDTTFARPGSISTNQRAWQPSGGCDGPPRRTDHTAHNALSTGSRSFHAPLRGVRFVEPSFFSCGEYVPPFPFRLHLLSTRVCHSAEKTRLPPWLKQEWCIPKVGAEFVWRMEDLLDLYQ